MLLVKLEKAHPDVIKALLALLYGSDTEIDFSDTTVIFTATLESDEFVSAVASRANAVGQAGAGEAGGSGGGLGGVLSTTTTRLQAAPPNASATHAAHAPTNGRLSSSSVRGAGDDEATAEGVRGIVARISPRLLDLVDDTIVIFAPLERSALRGIVSRTVRELANKLNEHPANNVHVTIKLTASAMDQVLREGCDAATGAHGLRRYIEKRLAVQLSRMVFTGAIVGHGEVGVEQGTADGTFAVSFARTTPPRTS